MSKKYAADWVSGGFPLAAYSGTVLVEAENPEEAKRAARRKVWRRDFPDRSPSAIRVVAVQEIK